MVRLRWKNGLCTTKGAALISAAAAQTEAILQREVKSEEEAKQLLQNFDAPHVPSMLNDLLYCHCIAVAVSPNSDEGSCFRGMEVAQVEVASQVYNVAILLKPSDEKRQCAQAPVQKQQQQQQVPIVQPRQHHPGPQQLPAPHLQHQHLHRNIPAPVHMHGAIPQPQVVQHQLLLQHQHGPLRPQPQQPSDAKTQLMDLHAPLQHHQPLSLQQQHVLQQHQRQQNVHPQWLQQRPAQPQVHQFPQEQVELRPQAPVEKEEEPLYVLMDD